RPELCMDSSIAQHTPERVPRETALRLAAPRTEPESEGNAQPAVGGTCMECTEGGWERTRPRSPCIASLGLARGVFPDFPNLMSTFPHIRERHATRETHSPAAEPSPPQYAAAPRGHG